MKIIDGLTVAKDLRANIAEIVRLGKEAYGQVPGLAVILVGDDPASMTYVASKEKAAKEAGMHSLIVRMPANTTEDDLLEKIEELNDDDSIHGILVQLPLPEHISEMNVLISIHPNKDVDGLHPMNMGLLASGITEGLALPCTPYGVMALLSEYEIPMAGKRAVIIGRSNIVGKPMATLLTMADATVTICHSKTQNLKAICKEADILVAAIGRPKMINADYVKPGAVVIDVGINRVDGKLCGDVDFDSVAELASAITPVPKGVGPMTIAMLLRNTVEKFNQAMLYEDDDDWDDDWEDYDDDNDDDDKKKYEIN